MKYYKDKDNEVFAYELDGSQDHLITSDMVKLSAAAVELHCNPVLPEPPEPTYDELRRVEYAKLNQDEMRYDDLKNGTSTWEDAIDAIKLQYPKI